ncbi:MAG TPA: tRNA lysidine(34) synthetase TilS [Actinomycetota bacterium]|nr:tRNA lysidine(34) synthetase TilS [Actinomycetota bacterium]
MGRPPAVARVLERVTGTVRRHELLLPGETVVVAVSGGPDSVCLLHALVDLRRLLRVRLEVFHMDHGLRAGSDADAAYVRRTAERLRLPFRLSRAQGGPTPGASVEDWARQVRYRALALAMRDAGASKGATAHTLDDQAETVILGLLRGGGLDALAGIPPVHGDVVRPLLEVTRDEVEAFYRAKHLRPRTDPTNRDTRLLRNAVRLKAMPALRRAAGREIRTTIARTAAVLRRDADLLRRLATEAAVELVEETPDGARVLATALASLPTAIGARVLREAAYRSGVVPTAGDLDALLDLARGRPGRRRDLTAGSTASRDREYVSFSRASPESRV